MHVLSERTKSQNDSGWFGFRIFQDRMGVLSWAGGSAAAC